MKTLTEKNTRFLFVSLLATFTLGASAGIDDIIPIPYDINVISEKLVKVKKVKSIILNTEMLPARWLATAIPLSMHGSTLNINGNELTSPYIFNEPGAHRYDFQTWHTKENEIPYTDKQFYWMRTPVKVALKKGGQSYRH